MKKLWQIVIAACLSWHTAAASSDLNTLNRGLSLMGNSQLADDSVLLVQSDREYEDVVYLKNGSIIRGMVIDHIPMQQLKIQTKDGSIFVYRSDEIDRIAKEEVVYGESSRPRTSPYEGSRRPDLRIPAVGFLLSFLLLPGAGQYYNGAVMPFQHIKGAAFTVASIAGFALVLSATFNALDCYYSNCNSAVALSGAGLGLMLGSRLWSSIDALVVGRRINNRYYEVDDISSRYQDRYGRGGKLTLLPLLQPVATAGARESSPALGLQVAYTF